MKAVLVIDTTKCGGCPFCHKGAYYSWCDAPRKERSWEMPLTSKDIEEERTVECPLRPLPMKIDIKAQEDIDYQRFYENPDAKRLADEIVESQGATRIGSTRDIYHAWNACHDAITGETE